MLGIDADTTSGLNYWRSWLLVSVYRDDAPSLPMQSIGEHDQGYTFEGPVWSLSYCCRGVLCRGLPNRMIGCLTFVFTMNSMKLRLIVAVLVHSKK